MIPGCELRIRREILSAALVKRPEQNELRPVLEPFSAKNPPLPGGEPVAAGNYTQLKLGITRAVEDGCEPTVCHKGSNLSKLPIG